MRILDFKNKYTKPQLKAHIEYLYSEIRKKDVHIQRLYINMRKPYFPKKSLDCKDDKCQDVKQELMNK